MADFPRDAKLPPTNAPPAEPRCCLAAQNAASVGTLLGDAAFWTAMCPQLHVGDAETMARFAPLDLPEPTATALSERIARDGYYQLRKLPALSASAAYGDLALGVVQVRRTPLLP